MQEIKNLLQERKSKLLQMKKDKTKALKSVPEGYLRICRHGEKTQYYHRKDPKDFNGVYIKEKDWKLARKLAQKDYDEKVLRSTEKELKAIEKYLSTLPPVVAEQIYENLHPGRQQMVKPIEEPIEEYTQNWENFEYRGKTFDVNAPKLYTEKGERVRSKSEVIIADSLHKEGIPYRYECPLYLKGWGTVYPDFTVLRVAERKEIYWEHMGMMDEPEYAEKAIEKIALYEQNGIFLGENLVLTFETMKNPINRKVIQDIIRRWLGKVDRC
ncbi:MAG: hypothetical protein E7289_06535 [Lachnospiraceae bacterium]|nr:hypothetical protein [Lachnospiraceae bacterium]